MAPELESLGKAKRGDKAPSPKDSARSVRFAGNPQSASAAAAGSPPAEAGAQLSARPRVAVSLGLVTKKATEAEGEDDLPFDPNGGGDDDESEAYGSEDFEELDEDVSSGEPLSPSGSGGGGTGQRGAPGSKLGSAAAARASESHDGLLSADESYGSASFGTSASRGTAASGSQQQPQRHNNNNSALSPMSQASGGYSEVRRQRSPWGTELLRTPMRRLHLSKRAHLVRFQEDV